jgi:hypothetical protein
MNMMSTINDWNFPVEMMPTPNAVTGEPEPDAFQVIRTDTNTVLGHHGSRYKLVPHDDVVNSIMDAVKQSEITTDYKEPSISVFENGRKMRGEIVFPDLVVEPQVDDYVQARIVFTNSYDQSWSFFQSVDALRLWCLNGCTTPDAVARSRYKHTTFLNVDGSAAKIKEGIKHFHTRKDEWQKWMKRKISNDYAEIFFKKTIAKGFSRQQSVDNVNQKQMENLLRIWENETKQLGNNQWALYNCLTYWATHTQDARTPHVQRHNREQDIAKAMKSKMWTQLDVFQQGV